MFDNKRVSPQKNIASTLRTTADEGRLAAAGSILSIFRGRLAKTSALVAAISAASFGQLSAQDANALQALGPSNSNSNLFVSPNPLDFGTVASGASSNLLATITNSGTNDIPLSLISYFQTPGTLGSPQQFDFTVAWTNGTVVPAGGSATVNVTFTPITLSSLEGIANWYSPDGSGISESILGVGQSYGTLLYLTGYFETSSQSKQSIGGSSGTIQPLFIGPPPTSVDLTPSPTNTLFGNEVVGNSTGIMQIKLKNTGASTATINGYTNLQSAPYTNACFVVTGSALNTPPYTIAAGTFKVLDVQFEPPLGGAAVGGIVFTESSGKTVTAAFYGNGVNSNPVVLQWSAGVPIDPELSGYNVWRSTQTGGPYTLIASLSSATTNYTDSAVYPGQVYYYVVQATDGNGPTSGYSNEAH